MRRCVCIAMALSLGIWLAPLVVTASASEQKEGGKEPANQDRVEGNVHMIDKATKTVTVTLRGKGSERQVVYSDTTQFTFRNKPSTLDEVKDGRHVICLGKTNDKNQLIATRIDVRDKP
jgi:hypothetical protein